jgi:cytochrome c-type biogenesis protein CcsB
MSLVAVTYPLENLWHPFTDHFWLAKFGLWGLSIAWVGYLARWYAPENLKLARYTDGWLGLTCLALVGSLVSRSLDAGFFALSNMYESLLVLVISLLASFLVMCYKRFASLKLLSTMGWVVVTLALATFWFALSLPTGIQPLQPSLVSYWRSIHVPIIILSYALFTLAMVASLLQLGQARHDPANTLPAETFGEPFLASHASKHLSEEAPSSSPDASRVATESLAVKLETLAYRCIGLGFACLTVGIILGGLWANEAWGNYWSWDPKESMALVTLLGYGVYLHLRTAGQVSRRVLAWVSLASFVLMLITYFGVNLMGLGLHSYGKFS